MQDYGSMKKIKRNIYLLCMAFSFGGLILHQHLGSKRYDQFVKADIAKITFEVENGSNRKAVFNIEGELFDSVDSLFENLVQESSKKTKGYHYEIIVSFFTNDQKLYRFVLHYDTDAEHISAILLKDPDHDVSLKGYWMTLVDKDHLFSEIIDSHKELFVDFDP